MTSIAGAESRMLTANLAAAQACQPEFALPNAMSRVRVDAGVWRLDTGDRSVALHGRQPDREADRAVQELLGTAQPDVVIAIGLGLGFLLDALERRGWTGKVLAVEPEPATVAPLLARRDWQHWIRTGRLRILTAPDYAGASQCGPWLGDDSADLPVFVDPVLARHTPAEVERAHAMAARIRFDARANANARREFGGTYLLNTLANLQALAREGDVAALSGVGRDLPAFVVAAGPSLDENIAALREAQDRAFIIAVDTAARPLMAAGVTPHLIVAVDPGEANVRHLWDLRTSPATHLVAEASVDPSALAGFRGRTFLFSVSEHQPWPWLRAHGAGRGPLRAFGSVLTSAFDLALRMGCDPIAFAGADLAFTGGRPYARGVVYEDDWRWLAAWGTSIEEQWRNQVAESPQAQELDVDGAVTVTAPRLVAFRNWLVEQIARERDRRIVNVTGAGILHGGRIQLAPIERVIADLSPLRARPQDLIRARYAPNHAPALLAEAERLEQDGSDVLDTWEAFADRLSRASILQAVAKALDGDLPEPSFPSQATARARVQVDTQWLEPLAAGLPLVAMRIPGERMDPYAAGLRRFRFRTTAARVISCVLTMPDGAVTEDGTPMRRCADLRMIQPGEYVAWRDAVYIAGTGGSDPRRNGRTYALLVPETIAYLESLPLDEILEHRV